MPTTRQRVRGAVLLAAALVLGLCALSSGTASAAAAVLSADTGLSGLALSAGALAEVGSGSYAATVPYAVSSVTVAVTPSSPDATVRTAGTITAPGAPSAPIALPPGVTVVPVEVIAQDGSSRTYTVAVVRTVASTTAALSGLTLSAGSLVPAFSPGVADYTADVPNGTATLVLTPALDDPRSTVAVAGTPVPDGTASPAVPLDVGTTTVQLVVVAEDGTISTTYRVAVTRAGLPPTFTDGDLGPLQVGVVAHDGVAATGTPVIAYAVTAGALPDGLSLDGATGTVTGTPTTPGAWSAEVTASSPHGTATAQLAGVVARAAAPMGQVTDRPATGDPAQGAPVGFAVTGLRPGSATTVTLHSDPVVLHRGLAAADGSAAPAVVLPAGIAPGPHRVEFTGTGRDGTTVVTTVWLGVLPDGTVGPVSLTGPVTLPAPPGDAGPPSPAPAPATSAAPTVQALARTGADLADLGGLALLGLTAGGVLVAASRRSPGR